MTKSKTSWEEEIYSLADFLGCNEKELFNEVIKMIEEAKAEGRRDMLEAVKAEFMLFREHHRNNPIETSATGFDDVSYNLGYDNAITDLETEIDCNID